MSKDANDAHIEGMAVSVTLVFACEAHREAWLERTGWLGDEAAKADYEKRQDHTDLMFYVGPVKASDGAWTGRP